MYAGAWHWPGPDINQPIQTERFGSVVSDYPFQPIGTRPLGRLHDTGTPKLGDGYRIDGGDATESMNDAVRLLGGQNYLARP